MLPVGHGHLAAQVVAGERSVAVGDQGGEVAFEDDAAAQFAGAGPEVDDVVGGPHHVGIVFHDDNGVAEVAQFGEDADQPRRIAGMQADRRFVENVTRAHQTRTETCRELDALRFASRKSGGEAVERQILKPDVVQEFQTLPDLDQDLAGDACFLRREIQVREELRRVRDVHACGFGDGLAADAGVERVLVQPGPAAIGAARVAAIAAQKDAHVQLVFFGVEEIEELADAFDLLIAFQHEPLFFLGQIAEGNVEADAAVYLCFEIAQPLRAFRLGPGFDGAFVERQPAVGDDQIHRVVDGVAETLAARAGTGGAVEAEKDRLWLAKFQIVVLAHEALAEELTLARADVVEDRVARFAITDFDGVDDALMEVGPDGNAVGEDVDGLVPIDIEQRFGSRELEDRAVLPEAIEAARAELGEDDLRNLPCLVLDGKEDEKTLARGFGEHALRDLVDRVLFHAPPADGAERAPGAGPEQAHEVVDLGRGGDGRAGIAGAVFLPDGDGGRDAVDVVHRRFLHALEELAGIGRKRFDVAPLAFGVDGVERERRLARARDARDDGEFVVRNGEREVLEVVEACAAYNDFAETGLNVQEIG